MKRLLTLAALLLTCVLAKGQNLRFDAQATTVSTYGARQSYSVQVPLLALPNATISFYSCSGASVGTCNTLANTYNTADATTPCPLGAQVVLQGSAACTSTADNQGNFGAWFLPSGTYGYAYTISANSQTYGPFQFSVGGAGGSTPSPAVTGSLPRWTAKVANVKKGTGDAVACFITDSTIFGYQSGPAGNMVANSMPTQFSNLLVSSFGIKSSWDAWFGAGTGGYNYLTEDPRIVAGSFAASTAKISLGYQTVTATNPASPLTFTPTAAVNTFTIYYVQDAGLGSLIASLPGVSTVTQSTAGAPGVGTLTIAAASDAVQTLSLSATGTVYVIGETANDTTKSKVRVINAGSVGETSAEATNTAAAYGPGNSAIYSAIGCDLTVIEGGPNDWMQTVPVSTFQTNMQALVTTVLASTSDIAIYTPIPENPASQAATQATQSTFVEALRGIAAANHNNSAPGLALPLIDNFTQWQSWAISSANGWYAVDGIHGDAIGYGVNAQAAAVALVAAPGQAMYQAAGAVQSSLPPQIITGNYTVVPGTDRNLFTQCPTACAITLPNDTSVNNFVWISNFNQAPVTISPAGGNVAFTVTLQNKQSALFADYTGSWNILSNAAVSSSYFSDNLIQNLQVTSATVTLGTSPTNGTYTITGSAGLFSTAAVIQVVVAGGAVSSVTVTTPAYYNTTATFTPPAGLGTGATITAGMGYNALLTDAILDTQCPVACTITLPNLASPQTLPTGINTSAAQVMIVQNFSGSTSTVATGGSNPFSIPLTTGQVVVAKNFGGTWSVVYASAYVFNLQTVSQPWATCINGCSLTAGPIAFSGSGFEYGTDDPFLVLNAKIVPGTNNWTQVTSSVASFLFDVDATNGVEMFYAAAGTATGSKTAFWGTTPYFGATPAAVAYKGAQLATVVGGLGKLYAPSLTGQVPFGSMCSSVPSVTGYYCDGNSGVWTILPTGGGGGGTVTSVALSMPSIFTVSGSPVTASGTLAAALNTQAANLVFAGPASGAAVIPAFRALVLADIPTIGTGTGNPCQTPATPLTAGDGLLVGSDHCPADMGRPPAALGTAGQIYAVNAGATNVAPVTMSGDCTFAATGAITCTKTSGNLALGVVATVPATTYTGTATLGPTTFYTVPTAGQYQLSASLDNAAAGTGSGTIQAVMQWTSGGQPYGPGLGLAIPVASVGFSNVYPSSTGIPNTVTTYLDAGSVLKYELLASGTITTGATLRYGFKVTYLGP